MGRKTGRQLQPTQNMVEEWQNKPINAARQKRTGNRNNAAKMESEINGQA